MVYSIIKATPYRDVSFGDYDPLNPPIESYNYNTDYFLYNGGIPIEQ